MPYIPEDKKKEILDKASLDNTLSQYHTFTGSGSSKVDDCPKCGAKKKFSYSPAKKVAKCFSCDKGVKSPATYLTFYQGKTYPEALEELAKLEGVDLEDTKPVKASPIKESVKNFPKKTTQSKPKKARTPQKDDAFLHKTLKDSGLTLKDVNVDVRLDDDTTTKEFAYCSGTVDQTFKIIPGPDVIIRYYDLESKPLTYHKKKRNGELSDKTFPFYRVRFQNPELHKDSKGNSSKYKSPYGSDSKLYLPKILREKYQNNSRIETLYIQEGEKKADKACKHGLVSVGVMGIHNLAYQKSLPREFEMIIRRCQVENVVFVLDADCFDLATSIKPPKSATDRPYSFYKAVQNFKDYFIAYKNSEIYLNIFFAHIKKETQDRDKGLDDLLTNTLKGRENTLLEQSSKALLDPKGQTDYVQFYKITNLSDYKLKEFWHVQSPEVFIEKNRERLELEPVFKVNKIEWTFNAEGKAELAQPIEEGEKFWEYKQSKPDKEGSTHVLGLKFNYNRCYKFLANRGFGRYAMPGGSAIFVHQEKTIVKEVDKNNIKDFVVDFTKSLGESKYEDVLNLLFSGGTKYLGPDSLSNLEFKLPLFHGNTISTQYMYFSNSYWKITKDGIEENALPNLNGHVWEDKIIKAAPTKTESLINDVYKIDAALVKKHPKYKPYINQGYLLNITEDGEKCDFLHFLFNASNFHHNGRRYDKEIAEYSTEQRLDTNTHFLSKLTAIGYLLNDCRNPNILKAIIAMDGKLSNLGDSNGRSGKSLIGEFVRWLIPTVFIDGKKPNLLFDKYIWDSVTERTQNVFIDDIDANFPFELLYPTITGDFQVEQKGLAKFTLPKEKAPKFYITTNHTVRCDSSSDRDRQNTIAFSDWYSDEYKPTRDTTDGQLFFEYWSPEQTNLAYNFAATCLQLYFKFGLIKAPNADIEKRVLLQKMGAKFLEWAEETFSNPENLNREISRKSLYDANPNETTNNPVVGESYLFKNQSQKKYYTANKFKKKITDFCKFKDYEFNPTKDGGVIKSNGVEYFHIHVPENVFEKFRNNE